MILHFHLPLVLAGHASDIWTWVLSLSLIIYLPLYLYFYVLSV